jgi:hypothetical protein
MKKTLISVAFGAATLVAATFATAQPAKADVDVYLGTPGVSIGYSHRCRDYYYRRAHPYRCNRYSNYYPAYAPYRDERCFRRWYREEHPRRCRWWYRRYGD